MQVDVARIGGVTPWLKVAHLAETFNVAVAPHYLMELHVSLCAAVPNATWVEHIPQLDLVTTEVMRIEDGYAIPSDTPGLGIAWDHAATACGPTARGLRADRSRGIMRDLFSLAGRLALITGSSRGIGWAVGEAFASAGARVILHGRDEAALNERVATLAAAGRTAYTARFDVGDAQRAAAVAADLQQRHGAIDILVSNAGAPFRETIADTSLEEWRGIIESHLTTAFSLARTLAPGMAARQWGRIIIMSSVMGTVSRPSNTAYSAAKGGLNALVRALCAELGPAGITCNAIAPGWISTDATQVLREDQQWSEFIVNRNALKRWGRPEEVAAAALFLASGAGAFVTGQVLTVDGGLSAVI